MALRQINFASDQYYHIYNRGNSKQMIFHDEEDSDRFCGLLYVCNQNQSFKINNLPKDSGLFDINIKHPIVSIGAWCLMSNHFHILIKETTEGGITLFMRKVMTAYVMYYNKKYKRIGKLFEGVFKAQHIQNDRYLKYLFSYIHLNPVKHIDPQWKKYGLRNIQNTKKYLLSYKYSSLPEYLGKERVHNKILQKEVFPEYFPGPVYFWKELNDWLDFSWLGNS